MIQAARSGGNQRRYPRAILRRVAFIKVAQRVGIPLAEIAEALQALPAGARRQPPTGGGCHANGAPVSTSASAR